MTTEDDEFGLLACAIEGGSKVTREILGVVRHEMFAYPEPRKGMKILARMIEIGEEISMISFARRWNQSVRPNSSMRTTKVFDCPNQIPSASNWTFYYESFVKDWHAFESRKVGQLLAEEKITSDEAISRLNGLALLLGKKQGAASGGEELVDGYVFQENRASLSTGYSLLDEITDGGFAAGDLVIVGARPSVGKTIFGLQFARHCAMELRVPTLFISLEMTKEALVRRMISEACQIPLSDIRRTKLTQDQLTAQARFLTDLRRAPLWIQDCRGRLSDYRRVSEAVEVGVSRHRAKVVVIDYLQKMTCSEGGMKMRDLVSAVSASLVSLKSELGITLLALAQVSRDVEKENRTPRISDLAECSHIEQDADTILLLHRAKDHKTGMLSEKGRVIVAKQRDGANGYMPIVAPQGLCSFVESLSALEALTPPTPPKDIDF